MPQKIFNVCAGWLSGDPVIGKCFVDNARGSEIISFEYEREWLLQHTKLTLGEDIQNMPGRQFPANGRNTFAFLSDVAPDRWGRTLMDRRERADAENEKRTPRRLMESDYLLGVHDGGRVGGLRFQDVTTGKFLACRQSLAAPPITELRKLQQASGDFERRNNAEKWLNMLVDPGSSLGGARPKANVIDEYGHLWIAKFPSRHDTRNVGAWEMVEHELALRCGLKVPSARIENLTATGSTFLCKRFDRFEKDNTAFRKHMASAMTMLNAQDGDSSKYSYLDLLDVIERTGNDPQHDIPELWQRMIFNICTGNTDDHLRNHAFILQQDDGWRMSPAFDMNPEPDRDYMSLNIDFGDPTKDIRKAIDVAEYFRMTPEAAKESIQKTQKNIRKNLDYLCKTYHISQEERTMMQPAFAEAYRDLTSSETLQKQQ